jgi:hypothetical protein
VLQHRFFVLLIVIFAFFEWRIRATDLSSRAAAMVFPLLCAAGGTMLLTHSHAIANVKDQLLIELTHTPLALAGIAAGWARWLEIRLNPRENPVAWQIAGWIWPLCIVVCGLLLLGYREAEAPSRRCEGALEIGERHANGNVQRPNVVPPSDRNEQCFAWVEVEDEFVSITV